MSGARDMPRYERTRCGDTQDEGRDQRRLRNGALLIGTGAIDDHSQFHLKTWPSQPRQTGSLGSSITVQYIFNL